MKIIFLLLYFFLISSYLLLLFSFIREMERIGEIVEKKMKRKENRK